MRRLLRHPSRGGGGPLALTMWGGIAWSSVCGGGRDFRHRPCGRVMLSKCGWYLQGHMPTAQCSSQVWGPGMCSYILLLFLCSLILVRLVHISVIYLKIVFDFHKKRGKYKLGHFCAQRWFLGGKSCQRKECTLSRL